MPKPQLYQHLLATLAGVAVLSGCGGSETPVKATDVPAAEPSGTPAAMPSGEPAAPMDSAAPAPGPAADATPTPSATPSAAPSAMPKAKDMPKTNHSTKVSDSKRTKACQGGCGEGTCGTPCK